MDDNMMKAESQNIEFKESWRDEYQKWICGFANAQGGVLYVGVKDNGEVCGLQDAKKLMEDILHRSSAMMLRAYGQSLSLNTLKGRQPKTTQKRPRKATQNRPRTDQKPTRRGKNTLFLN